ncbi:unnamed protein product [Rotaria sordida]|uniref:Uncharacterized protein n=1 Tax=Rotaria sordida TaxID=392033 RepID=A0A818NVU4_9BILA|nr:unnamed protein product [Rotaria sordida]
METKVFIRCMYNALKFTCIYLLFFALIWICLQFYESRMSLSKKKTWLCLRFSTLPCSLSEECIIFNVTCYSNGKIIFHGINNTAYTGKKIFQLQTNRMITLNEFIQTHSFISDIQSIRILFHIESSHNNNEIYFWRNDTITYRILISLLNIDKLSSYKHWPILLRTTYILSNIQQRKESKHFINISSKQIQTRQQFKRSIKNQNSIRSTRTKRLIVPIAKSSYTPNDNNNIFPDNTGLIVSSLQTLEFITEKFNDNICFSSQVIESKFDLIDACLSTNDIIGDNQFYALRDQFTWFLNQTKWPNGLIDSQAKNAVNDVVNNRSKLIGPNDSRITTAQALVNDLESTSSIKPTLQQTLDNIKASFNQTTISFNGTLEAVTTISSANTTFHTTIGPSNEPLQTTVSTSGETLHSTPGGSNKTQQTTVSSADTTLHTTVSSSNETLQTTVITSGETFHSTPGGSNEIVHTTVSSANTTLHTRVGLSNGTTQTTIRTSSETFHSTLGGSNETVQTTVSLADTTLHTTVGPSNETLQPIVSTSGETFHSTLGRSNETLKTTVSSFNETLDTTIGIYTLEAESTTKLWSTESLNR